MDSRARWGLCWDALREVLQKSNAAAQQILYLEFDPDVPSAFPEQSAEVSSPWS